LPALHGAAEDTGLKWAVLPDKNGDIKAYLAYDLKFLDTQRRPKIRTNPGR